MYQAAITLLTIFAVVSTTLAFQPTTRIHGNKRHANDSSSCFRRESSSTKLGVVGFWDALPFAPKYNKITKTNNSKAEQEVAQVTKELEKVLDDAKASIDVANLALQDADSVLSQQQQQQQQPEKGDDSSDNDWSSMTVPMLKQALKDRGLKVSGKKVELVDRLESFESEKLDYPTDDDDDDDDAEDDDAEDVSVVAEEVEEAEEAAEEVEEIEEAVETEETVPTTVESDDSDDETSDEWEWTEVDEVSDVDYSSMTVSQLKEELRSLDLAVGGKKVDLIARLESYHVATASIEEIKLELEDLEELEVQEPEPVAAIANDDSGDDDASSASSLDLDYTEYTVAQLKVELRKNGLKVGGKKSELIERLQNA
ncbi:MAG: hypothetical protein SGBAC_002868 [Bacillariaceae sp.]